MRQNSKNIIAQFYADMRGQISIMFVLLLVPITLLIGGALDFSAMLLLERKNQQSIDGAVLAAAKIKLDKNLYATRAAQEGRRKEVFLTLFKANNGDRRMPIFDFTFSETGMSVTAKNQTKTTLLRLAGINNLAVITKSASSFPSSVVFEIVLVFDSTGSMGGIIGSVKNNAINFTPDLLRSLSEKGIELDSIYTKVISYKDYWVDSLPMYQSNYYKLPEQNTSFVNVIRPIVASGGGDAPESGLEALKFAMNSKSTARKPNVDTKKLIVFWTDISAIPLVGDREGRVNPPGYPSGMPSTLAALKTQWDGDKNTELLIFYPNATHYPWKDMKWGRITHTIGNPNHMPYNELIDNISEAVNNIGGLRLTE